MKEIKLTQGKVALVDDEDFEYLNQWKWCVHKGKGNLYYAIRNKSKIKEGSEGTVYMHKVLMNTPNEFRTDHKNGNTLDNQKHNLRITNHCSNIQNRKKNINNTSGYKGVSRNQNKWMVQLNVNNKHIYGGKFINIIEAARHYDDLALKYFGEYAKLNFERSVSGVEN